MKTNKEIMRIINSVGLEISFNDFPKKIKKEEWIKISECPNLSEDFIRCYSNKLSWECISIYQDLSKLSLDFIDNFKDELYWAHISKYQILPTIIAGKFADYIDLTLYERINKYKTHAQKIKEAREYAKKNDLYIDANHLYAYRNHDSRGSGFHLKSIKYKEGQYYRDWHCDMRGDEENSFGYGVIPEGNTPIKIKIDDWGVEIDGSNKARVWGFEIIDGLVIDRLKADMEEWKRRIERQKLKKEERKILEKKRRIREKIKTFFLVIIFFILYFVLLGPFGFDIFGKEEIKSMEVRKVVDKEWEKIKIPNRFLDLLIDGYAEDAADEVKKLEDNRFKYLLNYIMVGSSVYDIDLIQGITSRDRKEYYRTYFRPHKYTFSWTDYNSRDRSTSYIYVVGGKVVGWKNNGCLKVREQWFE